MFARIEQELYRSIGAKESPDIWNENEVSFAYTLPEDIEEGLAKVMQLWVNTIDSLLRDEPTEAEFVKLWAMRGLTPLEYQQVFDAPADEEEYHIYRGLTALKIRDKHDRYYFTSENSNDFEGYIRVIQALNLPVLTELSKKKMMVHFPIDALHRHTYITGASGSGKTELMKLLIYDLQRRSQQSRNHGIFLIEPHGDVSFECLGFAMNKQRDRVIYINPHIHKDIGCEQRYLPVINPFELTDKSNDNVDLMAQQLTSAFMQIINDGSLTTPMNTLLTFCINAVLRQPNATIDDLVRFMDDSRNNDLVQLGMKHPEKRYRDFFEFDFKQHNFDPTKKAVKGKLLSLLGLPMFEKLIVGKSTIDLEKEMDAGKVVLFNLSPRMGDEVASAYGRLIIAYMQGLVKKRIEVDKRFRKPVFLFIDECQYFISPSVKEILTGARKFGLHLVFAQQVVGSGMTADLQQIVMSNTAIKITGINDSKSIEEYAKNVGAKLTDLKELKKHTFYVHNKYNEEQQKPFLLHPPAILVKQHDNPHYLTKAEKHELLVWMAEKSGYYRPYDPAEHELKEPDPTQLPTGDGNATVAQKPDEDKPIKPAFTGF